MSDDVMLILGRLEGKMDGFMVQITKHDEQITKLDNRVDLLEQGKARSMGAIAGVSGVIGILGGWLGRKLGIV